MDAACVPAILAYKAGELFANLVAVVEEIPAGRDMSSMSLELLLKQWVLPSIPVSLTRADHRLQTSSAVLDKSPLRLGDCRRSLAQILPASFVSLGVFAVLGKRFWHRICAALDFFPAMIPLLLCLYLHTIPA